MTLQYENGERETIVSDTAWKTADSPILFSLRRCGGKYDARLEIPGWCDADFDDSGWDNAYICQGPGGALRATDCPSVQVVRRLPGRKIALGVFGFSENISGWMHLTVHGKRGEQLDIRYAEKLASDGYHVEQSNMLANIYRPMAHRDVYILKGEPGRRFRQ